MAKDAFAGFHKDALSFFRNLEANNDRDYFNAHKADYERLLAEPMRDLVARLSHWFRGIDPAYANDPKRAIYRIHRDTRFSKDKTPLKLHLGAQFQHPSIAKHQGAGFYFHVSHQQFMIGAGLWMPGPDELKAFRQAVVDDAPTIHKLLADKRLIKLFGKPFSESMKRDPKGFEGANPLVRCKQLGFVLEADPKRALSKTLERDLQRHFEPALDLVNWINHAILRGMKLDEAESRPRRPEPMF